MVWYQKFEYAIGHWLQKAAEHMLGCVLCSPGCFSLFRGSAIMDDNVMRTYATKSTEARHYVQYDQGNSHTNAVWYADCKALSADCVNSAVGFLCGTPDGLELTTDWVSWSLRQTASV